MATGFVHHEIYLWHDTRSAGIWLPAGGMMQPEPHAESPDSKRRLRNLLEVSGLLDSLTPIAARPATEEELLRFHTPDYIARLKALSAESGGDAGMSTPFGPGSYEIALLSVGGVIAALDAVVGGQVDNAYALVRPPGHHAEADMGKGFCLLGNAVIAIKHAIAAHGIERVATVDWDVHHGNGTEHAFLGDPNVLTISIHQDNCFPPDSGAVGDTGEGAGEGYKINVPLPPGSGREAYLAAFERVVEPALRAFKPELIVVPSGFDGSAYDPLGRMMVSSETYRRMARAVLGLARELCGGRLVLCHEGGYSTAYVPFCGLAVIEELSGSNSGVEDPFLAAIEGMGGHQLYPHQAAVIDQAAELAAKLG